MTFGRYFRGMPILGWAIDDWEAFEEFATTDVVKETVDEYTVDSYRDSIEKLFTQSPIKLNLGGEEEKSKLITTDRPTGIFDFSLASKGMYKVVEYYSEELAQKYPDRFKENELPSGVVPPDLVHQKVEGGRKIFFYEDNQEVFECVIRQKGETAIEQNLPNAKLKYSTRAKKVYLTYKRNRGRVRYVEIYSLFYYSRLKGNIEFAIRHIPAIMVAEYLESIGVKVRFYMTRFVKLGSWNYPLDFRLAKKDAITGMELPMYEKADKNGFANPFRQTLFVQPILAKDFAEEFDKAKALAISSAKNKGIYEEIAKNSQKRETNDNYRLYGDPDFDEIGYYEGFERYRNKYQEYVKKGVFKSKEVLPEAMLFFHDLIIADYLSNFMEEIDIYAKANKLNYDEVVDVLLDSNVNPFFVWWMRLSATNLKNKINIINSDSLVKDFKAMEKELNDFIDQYQTIVAQIPDTLKGSGYATFKENISSFGRKFLELYGVSLSSSKLEVNLKNYVQKITIELTTYAEEDIYATPEEEIERRNNLLERVFEALSEI